MNSALLAIVANHLWQSTLFALGIAAFVVLLQKNSARARYWLWLAASLKFLVPFAALAAIGTQIPWQLEAGDQHVVTPRILEMAGDFTVPLEGELPISLPWGDAKHDTPRLMWSVALLSVWGTGALFVAGRWLVRWFRIWLARWRSRPVAGDFPTRVRVTSMQFEPGIVGIIRPVLLLPEGLEDRLTPEQIRAVLAHERCHLRWRDNLTASLHMLVETVFWFFPPVWWIGARLIEEREQACDEQVIRDGHAPQSYVEGILAVCEHYIASRLPCVSGVSGADLRKRIESILASSLSLRLTRWKKLALAGFACYAVAAPLAAGMASGGTWQVLFSLNAEEAAALQFMQLAQASAQAQWADRSDRRCPAPNLGPRVSQKQKALGATVAKLSPWDRKAMLFAVGANSTRDVQRLLDGGAPRDADGFFLSLSIMHAAAEFGDARMLDMLQAAGFGVDGRFIYDTPLKVAITSRRRENIEWFIQHGASVAPASTHRASALTTAMTTCHDQEVVTQLLNAGAPLSQFDIRRANSSGFDLSGNQPWHVAPKTAVLAVDFDGDGTTDRAALRLSADGKRSGVFATISSRDADRWIEVAEDRSPGSANDASISISMAAPGSYRTECYWAYLHRLCTEGEVVELVLQRPGIRLVTSDGTGSIVFWDKAGGGFERLGIRD